MSRPAGKPDIENATVNENVSLTASNPLTGGSNSTSGQTPNGWHAQAVQQTGGTVQWTLQVWAVCTAT